MLVHFGKAVSEETIFQKCLLTDRDEMSNHYRGSSIDASYQVSVNWTKRFQRRHLFQKSTNQKQEFPVAVMLVNESGRNQQSLQMTFQGCFLPNVGSFSESGFRGEDSLGEKFRNRPKRNKYCLWWPCLLTNRDEMSNLYRGPSKDPSYQIVVHFGKAVSEENIFQAKKFRNRPIRNKNCLWWPWLLTNRDEMSNLYRRTSIDAVYQVSYQLSKCFQRRSVLKHFPHRVQC